MDAECCSMCQCTAVDDHGEWACICALEARLTEKKMKLHHDTDKGLGKGKGSGLHMKGHNPYTASAGANEVVHPASAPDWLKLLMDAQVNTFRGVAQKDIDAGCAKLKNELGEEFSKELKKVQTSVNVVGKVAEEAKSLAVQAKELATGAGVNVGKWFGVAHGFGVGPGPGVSSGSRPIPNKLVIGLWDADTDTSIIEKDVKAFLDKVPSNLQAHIDHVQYFHPFSRVTHIHLKSAFCDEDSFYHFLRVLKGIKVGHSQGRSMRVDVHKNQEVRQREDVVKSCFKAIRAHFAPDEAALAQRVASGEIAFYPEQYKSCVVKYSKIGVVWVRGRRVAAKNRTTGEMDYDEDALKSLDAHVQVDKLRADAMSFRQRLS